MLASQIRESFYLADVEDGIWEQIVADGFLVTNDKKKRRANASFRISNACEAGFLERLNSQACYKLTAKAFGHTRRELMWAIERFHRDKHRDNEKARAKATKAKAKAKAKAKRKAEVMPELPPTYRLMSRGAAVAVRWLRDVVSDDSPGLIARMKRSSPDAARKPLSMTIFLLKKGGYLQAIGSRPATYMLTAKCPVDWSEDQWGQALREINLAVQKESTSKRKRASKASGQQRQKPMEMDKRELARRAAYLPIDILSDEFLPRLDATVARILAAKLRLLGAE
jgi:hypothetical protein